MLTAQSSLHERLCKDRCHCPEMTNNQKIEAQNRASLADVKKSLDSDLGEMLKVHSNFYGAAGGAHGG